MNPMKPEILVRATNLKKYFPLRRFVFGGAKHSVKAVDDVSLTIYQGETLGLVGESGCGKSTLGRALLGVYAPTAGQVAFEGQNIADCSKAERKQLKQKMQLIFQDPSGSLNPRRQVKDIVAEPFIIHKLLSKSARAERVRELLDVVGISAHFLNRYPHELSGGQKQRIGIARALALHPRLVICDEAVSALDVSIQAQVIALLEHLQQEFRLTYLFISHDLNVVYHISDRVGVMYLGKIVELGNCHDLYFTPLHPYTQALLSAIPTTNPEQRQENIILQGDLPSPANPPTGCRFHPRCWKASERCVHEEPLLEAKASNHYAACHAVT